MSAALIGIIIVQISWIRNAMQIREKQFSRDAYAAIEMVAKNIENKELKYYFQKFNNVVKDRELASKADISRIIYEQIDTTRNEKFTYARTILEQKYKVPTEFFDQDSLTFKKTFSKKDVLISRHYINEDDIKALSPEEHSQRFSELTSLDKEFYRDLLYENIKRTPINTRISSQELEDKLKLQFEKWGIDTPFQFAIYDKNMLTAVKSGYFKIKKGKTYHTPIFNDEKGTTNYELYVNFPEKKQYIISNISKNLILSILFIFSIIGVFAITLYQLKKQKRIAAIKTDFINNMTHEFKTPIATINLALDAIKNPQVIHDEQKILQYVGMIREENKRMHAQVETVLRISKLEKNQLDVSKDVVDIHEIIEEAMTHLGLLLHDRKGKIDFMAEAIQTEVVGNAFHLTNVFVNLLDNAIKYTTGIPKIIIKTENKTNSIIISISDNGIGMSKQAQKNIFDKFYREETGNVHNVKGHGLGLSYVKRIIDIHQGSIHVESEKGKGSTFSIQLSVI